VLICSYNRAALLRETLESLRAVSSVRRWDVVVVDNNSRDNTSQVVAEMAPLFPVPLLYVFESRQGKSYALNTGIERSRGDVIVFTDDDVQVVPRWLDEACAPLDVDPGLDYTGGPVRPLWGGTPPDWLDQTRSDLWGTLAILDYGTAPFIFEARWRVPVGANMAVRRRLFERLGGFHPDLGRRGASLIGQEQAEFFARGRAAGARGVYAPRMEVHHHVPASRLTKRYFRRWWFCKGVSRARVDFLHQRTELGLDLREVPHVARVPRFIWGMLPRSAISWLKAAVNGDARGAARHEMHCAYVLGYVRACWAGRSGERTLPPVTNQRETASVSR
jgi:glycosyltransferase involved in cell wall biosynthesis